MLPQRVRKILKSTPKTKKYLESLPKLYGIFLWAKWGMLELSWTGKYDKKTGLPLVYIYHDFNGMHEEYYLSTIDKASSGGFYYWYETKEQAEEIKKQLNEALQKGKYGI